MRILVTGGAGFIGSHLVEKLLAAGFSVDNIDNFVDYYDPQIKRDNIAECLTSANFRLLEGDIRDRSFLADVFDSHEYEMVIHLAAMAGVRPSLEQPLLYSEVNIGGTQNLLEECRKSKIKKFIFASSSSVYGNNPNLPFREDDPVDYPISPYAATKKAAELICHTYHHLFDISMICLRFFTVYGPRQRPDLAIHKFTRLISEGQSVKLYGDGSTARDYTYIDDVISGIMGAVKYVYKNKCYEVINLGESKTINLLDMVNIISEEMGKKVKKEFVPMQAGDVQITYASIDKARKMIGYHPDTDFREGIRKFLGWYYENNKMRYMEDQ
ncbi:MAG: GDP-mannose 4,6-dehydratase [Candidatus Cloacimonetes bacterium]|nr:GDP-mannose 4,6-dehydratase [Candidatus Cloacimonadota bacterium]